MTEEAVCITLDNGLAFRSAIQLRMQVDAWKFPKFHHSHGSTAVIILGQNFKDFLKQTNNSSDERDRKNEGRDSPIL